MGTVIKYFGLLSYLFLCAGTLQSFGQVNERDIKLSGNYYWGEGFGDERETAVNNAKRDLIERLIVRVTSDATLSEQEMGTNYTSNYESSTSTMSRMELRGLNYMAPRERPNGSWEALAYVSKKDFMESMDIEAKRLVSALSQAINNEYSGRMDAAIPQYMDIYASTFFFPVPFFTDEEEHGSKTDLRTFLAGKISDWVNSTEVKLVQVRSLSTTQNVELYIDLNLEFNGQPVDHLSVRINRPGYAKQAVRNGSVSVFTDIFPESPTKEYVFELSPIIPENIDDDKKEILAGILPSRELSQIVDFLPVIELDIEAELITGSTYTFSPVVKNLSVFSVEWKFEESETSSSTNPRHQFKSIENSPSIWLKVNGNDELTVERFINKDGILTNQTPQSKVAFEEETIVTNTDEVARKFEIPYRESGYVSRAIRMQDGQKLTQYLNRLKQDDLIYLGRKTDVQNSEYSYVAIIDPTTKKVQAILSPIEGGIRFDITTQDFIEDAKLGEVYRGMGSVWFQFK